MKATAWLVCQLPSGLPPLLNLDAALPLDESLCDWEGDNLDHTSDKTRQTEEVNITRLGTTGQSDS